MTVPALVGNLNGHAGFAENKRRDDRFHGDDCTALKSAKAPMKRFTGGIVRRAAAFVAAACLLLPGLSGGDPRADWDAEPCIAWPDGRREAYAVFDTLYLQRDNAANDVPLIANGDTNTTVFSAPDLQFAAAPGIRLLAGEHGPHGVGWEVGYVGVYGMFASDIATGGTSYEIAPPLSSVVDSFTNASVARATYASQLNMAEANLLFTHCHENCHRWSGYSMERQRRKTTIDWIAGFRWAGLEEQATLDFTSSTAGATNSYAVQTSSNLFAGQLGLRGRTQWRHWAVEAGIKAGLAGTALSQSQAAIIDPNTGLYRPAGAAQTGGVGGIFDINASLVRRLSQTWWLRLGYSSFWLTGVALAPDQFDFAASTQPVTTIDVNKSLWLGGANLGLEKRW
jgi:hypothetical protein